MTELTIATHRHAEFVPITDRVQEAVTAAGVRDGVCTVFVPHTTAGITINDPVPELADLGIGQSCQACGPFGVLDSGRQDVAYQSWHGHALDADLLKLLQRY